MDVIHERRKTLGRRGFDTLFPYMRATCIVLISTSFEFEGDGMNGPRITALRLAERRTGLSVVGGFVRLSKIVVYQHYYGWALAWLLLDQLARDRAGATTAMLLFLLGSIGIVSCTCSADDLVGFRNGSDAMNYQSVERRRKIWSKPLLTGALVEHEAIAFMIGCGAVAVLAGLGAFWALDWQAPPSAYVLYFGGFFVSVQYSAGMRSSYYRGGTEVSLCLCTACGLLAPYLAVAGYWSPQAVIAALLLGLWLVMVSTYSNVNDIEGDRQVGRNTLAVATSPAVIKTVMLVFFLLSTGLCGVLSFDTRWPWWTLLTLLPTIGLHVAQLYIGPVRGEWLRARRYGLFAYDLGFLGLCVPILFIFSGSG
jgi:1,4-dihydroxy-2-naphthoate polyprenyltransferase